MKYKEEKEEEENEKNASKLLTHVQYEKDEYLYENDRNGW
jgi:hypothetical protein